MSLTTDPSSAAVQQAQQLVHAFPIASFGESALLAKLQQMGIDYQNDIHPLLGNPVLLAASGNVLSSGTGQGFLIVWVTKDAGKLAALVKKIPGDRQTGTRDGASIYSAGGSATFAVDGATLVFSDSPAELNAALDRHAHGGGLTSSQLSQRFRGLPQNGLLQISGDLQATLAQPSAASARKVPWVAALRSYGVSVSATSSGLSIDFHLDTTGRALTAAQVPFAPGAATPHFAGNLPITVGVEDPAHTAAFAESAAQAASPVSFAKFLRRQAALRQRTGVDLNSLLSLMTGELVVSSDTHVTMARVALSNPAEGKRVLAKLMSQPQTTFKNATGASRLRFGFYGIHQRHGTTITVGIVGNQLLIGKAGVSALQLFAAAPPTVAPGAQGSVAFRVALMQLLHLALHQQAPAELGSVLNSLGDVSGWITASTSGLTGNASLAAH
jgi:hypothetical protein